MTNNIDLDYWIEDVEFGQIRGRLIQELFDLKNPLYQQKEWIKEDWDTSFRDNLAFSAEMFFDELGLVDEIESGEFPYDRIGIYLKSREEAEALMKAASCLRILYHKYGTNSEVLSSPYLPMLHKASKEAFEIFMENEKDNKEFCEFIEDLRKKANRS